MAIAFWKVVPQRVVDQCPRDSFLDWELYQSTYSLRKESTADVINLTLHLMMGDPVFEAGLHIALHEYAMKFDDEVERRRKASLKGGEEVDLDRRPGATREDDLERADVFRGLLRRWYRSGADRKGPWVYDPGDDGEHRDLEERR
jgi:hypothetical protein